MRFVAVFIAPHFYKQLIVSDDPARILNKVIQQAVFGRAQFNQLALQPDLTAIKIDLEPFIHLDDIVH